MASNVPPVAVRPLFRGKVGSTFGSVLFAVASWLFLKLLTILESV